MKRRQQSIIYQLAASEQPLTADELAERLGVSPRTVKSEMAQVKEELLKVGAMLKAKRNEGYSLMVTDRAVFDDFFEKLSFQSTLVNNFMSNDDACFLYVARKLASSSRYVKLEDLADELYTSKSALRKTIKSVKEFLESYHLEVESKPGLGIRAFGTEYHMRMAMTELFAVHFHKILLDHAGMEYAKWTACEYEERQRIRHCFLRVLRECEFTIRDVDTQRLAIYFIIVRNRCQAGYRLRLPAEWADEMRGREEYRVAAIIYEQLEAEAGGFGLPEEETVFLAVYLMFCRDWGGKEQGEQELLLGRETKALLKEMVEDFENTCHLSLSSLSWARKELYQILNHVLVGIHFELNGMKRFWYSFENQILKSPTAVELSYVMMSFLERRLGKVLSTSVFSSIAALIYKITSLTRYDIKKMKLLLVNSDGLGLNEIMEARIMYRYSNLIETCTYVELYEIRGLNQEEYDGVLTDTTELAYNYDLPYCTIHTLTNEREMENLYNKILIHAHQTGPLFEELGRVEVNQDFIYVNEEQFVQFISYRHGADSGERERMQKQLGRKVWNFQPGEKMMVLFWTEGEEERMELYCFKQDGLWNGVEISSILYVQVNWRGNWKKVKLLENALRQLTTNPQFVSGFPERPDELLEEMVRRSLKYE